MAKILKKRGGKSELRSVKKLNIYPRAAGMAKTPKKGKKTEKISIKIPYLS